MFVPLLAKTSPVKAPAVSALPVTSPVRFPVTSPVTPPVRFPVTFPVKVASVPSVPFSNILFVPLLAKTSPVKALAVSAFPVRFPVTFPVRFPVISPVTSPVRFPTIVSLKVLAPAIV